MNIPFNKPFIGKEEEQALVETLQSGLLRGDGPVTKRVQKKLQQWLGVTHVLLTTSCTHALEMAMLVLDIGPGDEVIMPSFNFVSSANAVVLRGGTPVFADIKPGTMNIDPEEIKRKISDKTKVIIPVHYAGVGCEMDAIMKIARKHEVDVVEDAAQAVDAYYKGKPLGTIGDIGCYSFHDTKNITCGEGGAFLTNNDDFAEKAEIIREKGTNRAAFFRGEIDKYSWVSEGSSYIPSDLLAALLEVQLERKDEIKQKRKSVWEAYYEALEPLEANGQLSLPELPEECDSNCHIFFFHVNEPGQQMPVINALKDKGIQASFHYVPLHSAPFSKNSNVDIVDLKQTCKLSETLVRLPVYPGLEKKVEKIGKLVRKELEKIIS
jgi:dTDP-4-amino-4,6-dideoxygalactose transaminase